MNELRAAIDEYRTLFKPRQLKQLLQQRRLAREAMGEFAAFRPRIFGDLVHGDGPLDRIRLMLIADTPEQVMHHLSDRHIPWQDGEAMLNYSGRRRVARPCLRFLAGESMVELVVLEQRSHSDPPRDPLTDRPMEMLGVDQLDALIANNPA
jgi:hypothetical protein